MFEKLFEKLSKAIRGRDQNQLESCLNIEDPRFVLVHIARELQNGTYRAADVKFLLLSPPGRKWLALRCERDYCNLPPITELLKRELLSSTDVIALLFKADQGQPPLIATILKYGGQGRPFIEFLNNLAVSKDKTVIFETLHPIIQADFNLGYDLFKDFDGEISLAWVNHIKEAVDNQTMPAKIALDFLFSKDKEKYSFVDIILRPNDEKTKPNHSNAANGTSKMVHPHEKTVQNMGLILKAIIEKDPTQAKTIISLLQREVHNRSLIYRLSTLKLEDHLTELFKTMCKVAPHTLPDILNLFTGQNTVLLDNYVLDDTRHLFYLNLLQLINDYLNKKAIPDSFIVTLHDFFLVSRQANSNQNHFYAAIKNMKDRAFDYLMDIMHLILTKNITYAAKLLAPTEENFDFITLIIYSQGKFSTSVNNILDLLFSYIKADYLTLRPNSRLPLDPYKPTWLEKLITNFLRDPIFEMLVHFKLSTKSLFDYISEIARQDPYIIFLLISRNVTATWPEDLLTQQVELLIPRVHDLQSGMMDKLKTDYSDLPAANFVMALYSKATDLKTRYYDKAFKAGYDLAVIHKASSLNLFNQATFDAFLKNFSDAVLLVNHLESRRDLIHEQDYYTMLKQCLKRSIYKDNAILHYAIGKYCSTISTKTPEAEQQFQILSLAESTLTSEQHMTVASFYNNRAAANNKRRFLYYAARHIQLATQKQLHPIDEDTHAHYRQALSAFIIGPWLILEDRVNQQPAFKPMMNFVREYMLANCHNNDQSLHDLCGNLCEWMKMLDQEQPDIKGILKLQRQYNPFFFSGSFRIVTMFNVAMQEQYQSSPQ